MGTDRHHEQHEAWCVLRRQKKIHIFSMKLMSTHSTLCPITRGCGTLLREQAVTGSRTSMRRVQRLKKLNREVQYSHPHTTRNSSIVRKFDFEASSRRIDPRHVELATVGCARDRFVDNASNSRIRTIERLAGGCRRETRMITDQAALDPEMRHA